MERITFETSDKVTIIGDWSAPSGAKKAALLLHMMPATRSSWKPLIEPLSKTGFATLAIDLRGHGESTLRQAQGDNESQGDNVRLSLSKPALDYKKFNDAEHQASRLDVDAAMNFLKQKGFAENSISLVGASIGANLSLDAMSRYKEISRGVLLSPGLDYRGVTTESAMKNLTAGQKVWLVAAEGDEYSAESVRALGELKKDAAMVTVYKGSEHGTNLFASQPNLIQDIVKFLKT